MKESGVGQESDTHRCSATLGMNSFEGFFQRGIWLGRLYSHETYLLSSSLGGCSESGSVRITPCFRDYTGTSHAYSSIEHLYSFKTCRRGKEKLRAMNRSSSHPRIVIS